MFGEILSIAGPVLGGLFGSDAASDAASAQQRASDAAIAEQRRQFDLGRKDLEPYRNLGSAATMRLGELLGLGGAMNPARSLDSFVSELKSSGRYNIPGQRLEQGTPIYGEGGIDGYLFADGTRGMNQTRLVGSNTIDTNALNAEAKRLFDAQAAASANASKPVDIMELDPGYQFRLGEGNKAIENAARARGMYMMPSTVKELMRYGQDFASNEFGNVFNRLSGAAGTGQAASNTSAGLGANMAGTVGGLMTGAANARGAAGIAGANALSGGINSAIGNWQQKNILDQIMNKGGVFNPYYTGMGAGGYQYG